jgi:hypothetical protein
VRAVASIIAATLCCSGLLWHLAARRQGEEEDVFDITWFTASAHGPGARAARITRISESKALVKFNKLVCGGGREAIIPNKCWSGEGESFEMRREKSE